MNDEQFEDKEKWRILMKSLEFFEEFDDAELDELLEITNISKYEANEYILMEGVEGYTFYVILRGATRILKRNVLGMKYDLGELKAGECFGEMAIILGEPRTASVRATETCYIFEISGELIAKVKLETQLKLYRIFAVKLAKRLKQSSLN